MAEPLTAAMPPDLDIGGGYTLRFDAVAATTGTTVPNVTVSQGRILAIRVTGQTDSGGTVTLGPYLLVPGPGA